jgi:Fe-S oxidoreductase
LREVLTHSKKVNPFESEEIRDVMDLCLSCKGCKSECPSNVDVAKLKAEATYQYYKTHSVPLKTKVISEFDSLNKLASKFPALNNFFFSNALTSSIIKSVLGIAPKRNIPLLESTTLKAWYKKNKKNNFGHYACCRIHARKSPAAAEPAETEYDQNRSRYARPLRASNHRTAASGCGC